MKLLLKLLTLALFLAGIFMVTQTTNAGPAAGDAQQLTGEAAREFLVQEGILPQLVEELTFVSPQGRNFEEPPPTIASDGAAEDSFGISVAVAEDTVVVGAYGADVSGDPSRGAAYIFTRSGKTWTQQQKLVAADGATGDAFGNSVAVDEDTVVIGAPRADIGGELQQGAAYVFTRVGETWTEQDKLTAGDGAAYDRAGYSVALDEDTIVIGANLANLGGFTDHGAVYVFTYSGGTWTEQGKLVASDASPDDNFGHSVDIDGDTLVGGAYMADVSGIDLQGAAYVFTRSGGTWTEQDKLISSDGAFGDAFGHAVAVDGDTVVVGANFADVGIFDVNQGAVYIFTRSGTSWSEQDKLTAGDGEANDEFGWSVMLAGDTVVIGAYRADVSGNSNQGAAYVFARSGTSWSERQKLVGRDGSAEDEFGVAVGLSGDTVVIGVNLADVEGELEVGKVYLAERGPVPWPQSSSNTANDGEADDWLGYSVAVDGDTAVVGAYLVDVIGQGDQGAVYVFTRNGTIWTEQDKLTALDGAATDHFGWSVAVDGNTVVVGADQANVGIELNQGAAYVFTRSGATWTEQDKLEAVDGAAGDKLGSAVAVEGDTAVVGASSADVGAESGQGVAYVFLSSGTTWSQEDKLVAMDGAANDGFGISVAVDTDTAVVGADRVDLDDAEDQGAAYVFTRTGADWTEAQKLTASDDFASDEFGQSVGLSGDRIVVGAHKVDAGGEVNRGAVYVFSRSGTTWSQEQKLLSEDGLAGDFFGFSVALSGDTAVVGAYLTEVGSDNDRGKVYFFERQPFFDVYLPMVRRE